MVLRFVSSSPSLSTLGPIMPIGFQIEGPPRKMRHLVCDDFIPSIPCRWTPLAISLEDLIGHTREYFDGINGEVGRKRQHGCVCGQSNSASLENTTDQTNKNKSQDNQDFRVELDVSGFKPSELTLIEGRGCVIVYGDHTDAYGSKGVKSTVKLPNGISLNELDVSLMKDGHLVLSKKQYNEQSKIELSHKIGKKEVENVDEDSGTHIFSLNAAGFDPSDFKVEKVDGGVVIVGEHKNGSSMRSMAVFHPIPEEVNVSNGTWSKQANGMMKFVFPKNSPDANNTQDEGNADAKKDGQVMYIPVNVDGAKKPLNNDSAENVIDKKRKTGGYIATMASVTKSTEKVSTHCEKENIKASELQNEDSQTEVESIDAEGVEKRADVGDKPPAANSYEKVLEDQQENNREADAVDSAKDDRAEKLASTVVLGKETEQAPPSSHQTHKDVEFTKDSDEALVTGDAYFVTRFEIPSADPSQLRLTALDSELVLTQTLPATSDVSDPEVKVTRRPLPEVDLAKMTSTWSLGTLTVQAPFLSAHSERAIPISCD